MGWQFRKTFKVIPGVRLNLTSRGLSATIGGSPFSVNVGPSGAYADLDLPGTGVHGRFRLDSSAERSTHEEPAIPIPFTPDQEATEIRSASTEAMNSTTMNDLKELFLGAHTEREVILRELATAAGELQYHSRRFHAWNNGFLFCRIFKKSFVARKVQFETRTAQVAELEEQLNLTRVSAEINIDNEQAEEYFKMRDAFSALAESRMIWDTLSRQAINRFATRSAASEGVTRATVSFSLGQSDILDWDHKVPFLQNNVDGDMYLYPGFLLYRASRASFALIDAKDVIVTFSSVNFIEDGQVPSDSRITGQAWAKSNKDGTPDRRFKENYQTPIAAYGSIAFLSTTGLREEYMISNESTASQFSTEGARYRRSIMAPEQESDAEKPKSQKKK